ncbi:MAG TPA: alanine--tRNA ligase [Nitrospiraceae bacterium]|nr:alanine--tRNA ligase [Nitrospiraceae bacterium]
MKSSEIRKLFIDYFVKRGHKVLPGSPLIPAHDPTLLLTNAGMVQFKSVFLGEEMRPYSRAVTVQKCMRAGGKHSDLENVGRTARHHTFFEMLGNFSFGDYFKRDAIKLAWEFLTEWMKLPKERLWLSIYEKDEDAYTLWQEEAGVSPQRIVRLGEKDNFWQMGDTGPCGPCSEIVIDQGPEVGCGKPDCGVGCDCDRFLELWNLVFMQYNRDINGKLTPLPRPSIDTGMGLERLTAVIQGKLTNFSSDLFLPIIKNVEEISGKNYGKKYNTDVSIRVIADHIRGITFLLSEGLMPSNEGRGYVLRRVIRRAARHGLMLGIDGPFLYSVVDPVLDIMAGPYPELTEELERSKKILRFEEERFAHTLSSGMGMLNDLIEKLKVSGHNTIPGDELFRLYDTFGFPLDLAQDIASDSNLVIDEKGFQREMELQRRRARASWVGAEEAVSDVYRKLLNEVGPTEFLGYDTLSSDSHILSVLKDGALVTEIREGEEAEIILDRTPFYGESGGQVGDTGLIKAEGVRIEVIDTKRPNEIFSHICRVKKGTAKVGARVFASVDAQRRKAIMRNHTATHLLHAALRLVLGDHVKQAGSLVATERLRFDFTHFSSMEDREIEEVEAIVNEKIIENMPVAISWMAIEDALRIGVTALFGEKYGDRVRVVKTGDFTLELCGGTHCKFTGEIGSFKIIAEGSVAAGVRRIDALTGFSALSYFREQAVEIKKVAALLKVRDMKVAERLEKFIKDARDREKELEKIKSKTVARGADEMLEECRVINGIKVLAHRVDGLDIKALRNLADTLKDRIDSGVLVLGSTLNGQASYVTMVTKDLMNRLHAGEILKEVTGGKGGGRADMAQGGTKDIENIDKALNSVYEIVRKKIS